MRARLSASDFAVASMLPDRHRRLALGLVLHGGDELRLRLLRGQAGDPRKLLARPCAGLRQRLGPLLELGPALFERLPARLETAALIIEPLLPLADPLLAPLQVAAELADLVLDGADLVLDLATALGGLLCRLLGRLDGPAEDPVRFGPRLGPDLLRFGLSLPGQLAGLLAAWLTAAPRAGNRRAATTNAPHAMAKATSPITRSTSAPLTVTPSVPLVTEPWRCLRGSGHPKGRECGSPVRRQITPHCREVKR